MSNAISCAVCERLHTKLVPVDFDREGTIDTPEDRERIIAGIQAAYPNERVIVVDANINSFLHCKAYRDENGKPRTVHVLHCTGGIPGHDPCRYWVGGSDGNSSVCWCSYRTKEERRREKLEAEANHLRHIAERAMMAPSRAGSIDITCD